MIGTSKQAVQPQSSMKIAFHHFPWNILYNPSDLLKSDNLLSSVVRQGAQEKKNILHSNHRHRHATRSLMFSSSNKLHAFMQTSL